MKPKAHSAAIPAIREHGSPGHGSPVTEQLTAKGFAQALREVGGEELPSASQLTRDIRAKTAKVGRSVAKTGHKMGKKSHPVGSLAEAILFETRLIHPQPSLRGTVTRIHRLPRRTPVAPMPLQDQRLGSNASDFAEVAKERMDGLAARSAKSAVPEPVEKRFAPSSARTGALGSEGRNAAAVRRNVASLSLKNPIRGDIGSNRTVSIVRRINPRPIAIPSGEKAQEASPVIAEKRVTATVAQSRVGGISHRGVQGQRFQERSVGNLIVPTRRESTVPALRDPRLVKPMKIVGRGIGARGHFPKLRTRTRATGDREGQGLSSFGKQNGLGSQHEKIRRTPASVEAKPRLAEPKPSLVEPASETGVVAASPAPARNATPRAVGPLGGPVASPAKSPHPSIAPAKGPMWTLTRANTAEDGQSTTWAVRPPPQDPMAAFTVEVKDKGDALTTTVHLTEHPGNAGLGTPADVRQLASDLFQRNHPSAVEVRVYVNQEFHAQSGFSRSPARADPSGWGGAGSTGSGSTADEARGADSTDGIDFRA